MDGSRFMLGLLLIRKSSLHGSKSNMFETFSVFPAVTTPTYNEKSFNSAVTIICFGVIGTYLACKVIHGYALYQQDGIEDKRGKRRYHREHGIKD